MPAQQRDPSAAVPDTAAEPIRTSTATSAIAVGPESVDTDLEDAEDAFSSTASIASSILEYRAINGRTYHSARHPTDYFTPNDEQHQESLDITHHYLTILLDGKLYLAPIPEDVKDVLDIGTGTGLWAIDFAESHPQARVIGTDLSPMQPSWVPANLRFEIDDATLPWTWDEGSFDFIHMRNLFGAIADWTALFQQAYRCCRPGGWIQSSELDAAIRSDDGTAEPHPVLARWTQMFREAGQKMGRPFTIVADGLQYSSMRAAGFTDITVVNKKLPVGGWPLDPKLKQVGRFSRLALESDMEGYTHVLWHDVLNWPKDEYPKFLESLRNTLHNRKIHGYLLLRYVYARKPQDV